MELNCDEQCGAIFKVEDGFIISCTLCEVIFKCFEEYALHVEKNHCSIRTKHLEQIKKESSIDDEDSLENFNKNVDDYSSGVLEETEHSIAELAANSFIDAAESFDSDYEDLDGYQSECNTPTIVTIERNDENHDDTEIECRPVRHKTMYFRPPDEIRRFKCTICSAAFKDSSTLRKHVIRHGTKKIHQCPQCQKKFYTSTDVKLHQRFHSKERPFLCTVCGITCISNIKLKDHMRRHTNERDYKCTDCDKRFFNASLLAKHKSVHSSDRPHICNICESKFAYRKGLQNHKKLHENKREYKCQLCFAAFNQQAGLFCHLKNKHKRA